MNFWTKKREKNPKEEWIYYENALPAIVSREYQEETIALLESRRYRAAVCNRMLAGRHDYSNKLFCEACGSFYYRSKIKSGGGELINWKCARQMQLGHEKCNNIIIEETELDRLLEKYAGQKFGELFTKDAGIAAKTVKWIGLALRDNSVEKLREDWTVELRRQKKKKDVLFAKLMEGTISDEDFKIYHRKQEQEIQSLQKKLDAIADETESGEKLREKLEKIQSRLQNGAVERKAVMLRLKSSIRRMTVKPSGRVTVFFEEEKLRDLLELYQMPEKENLFTMEFDYHRETKPEKKRRETNRKILEIFAANPQMTVADCAKALEMSYSYVYTSVAQLRKMGKLEEKNRRCRNACAGGQDAKEKEVEKSF